MNKYKVILNIADNYIIFIPRYYNYKDTSITKSPAFNIDI